MKQSPSCLRNDTKKYDFSWCLFLLSVIFSAITTYYVSAHYIDSDSSSELVLASHWLETKNIFSQDWLYGSELRLFHMQLVYAPLMILFDDWQMVRYIGALIMQSFYVASFGCLVHAAGKSRKFFFYGASLLLLPVSVTYGRIVLYHNHYLPNITIAFFLLALSMHFVDEVNWRSKKTWLRLIFLAGLSFAGGLNSIRQLMITHAPLLLIAFVFCWIEDVKKDECTCTSFLNVRNLNFLLCSIYSAVFSFLGLKAQGFLCDRFGLQIGIQSENNVMSFVGFNYIQSILYGFFHQFGYRRDVAMLSVSGILSLGSIFLGCYLVIISFIRLFKHDGSQDKRSATFAIFFWAYVTVMALIFLITNGPSGYYYLLFFSLCFSWAVPLVLINLEELPRTMHSLHIKKLFAAISVLLLLFTGIVNISYFQGSERFPQDYEGLSFQNRDKKADLVKVVSYLNAVGYDKGYAPHWESNIVTEITNGEMPMVTVVFNDYDDLDYFEYLTSIWLREAPCEKPFLLLDNDNQYTQYFQEGDSSYFCTKVYSGYGHTVYRIDNLDEFIYTLEDVPEDTTED